MIDHYLRKRWDEESGRYVAESWVQLNVLGFSWRTSSLKVFIDPGNRLAGPSEKKRKERADA